MIGLFQIIGEKDFWRSINELETVSSKCILFDHMYNEIVIILFDYSQIKAFPTWNFMNLWIEFFHLELGFVFKWLNQIDPIQKKENFFDHYKMVEIRTTSFGTIQESL